MRPFSEILTYALERAALYHGFAYAPGAASAWGLTGASYIGYVLCEFSTTRLRTIQYNTKEKYGSIILDCKWYDLIKQICLNRDETITALVPSKEDNLDEVVITKELLIEALDFCREG